jgi:hypothetical protein
MKLLEDNGIPALAIKGPILSQMIYGDITQRQFVDLDILISQKHIYATGSKLLELGYKSEYPIEYLANKTLLKIAKDMPFSNGNIHVEMHWRLFEEKFIQSKIGEQFNFSHDQFDMRGQNINVLNVDSLILYLCIHGSKHFWERLEWLTDIDRLIRKYDVVDWKKIVSDARLMGIETMLHLGLALTHQLFETKLPDYIIQKIKVNRNVLLLQEKINSSFVSNEPIIDENDMISFRYIYISSKLHDNYITALKTYCKILFQIKYIDIYEINLPSILSPLYYVVRPFRLLRDFIMHKIR